MEIDGNWWKIITSLSNSKMEIKGEIKWKTPMKIKRQETPSNAKQRWITRKVPMKTKGHQKLRVDSFIIEFRVVII